MNVLIGCEESGIIREAFRKRGHNAWSCDPKPTRIPGQHLQIDVLKALKSRKGDLFGAHPECTHLAVSGAHLFKAKRADGRQKAAIYFFMKLADADVPKKFIENPVSIMSTIYRKPDQYIQPYNFGHDASKKTCLWLTSLPPLSLGKYIKPRMVCKSCGGTSSYDDAFGYGCQSCGAEAGLLMPRWANQTDSGQNRLGPSETRSSDRARTYQGIADQMAAQWG
jgi:hypothetical protein